MSELDKLTKNQIGVQLEILKARIEDYEDCLFYDAPMMKPCLCCNFHKEIPYPRDMTCCCDYCILSVFESISIAAPCTTEARSKAISGYGITDYLSLEYRMLELICLRDYWEDILKKWKQKKE